MNSEIASGLNVCRYILAPGIQFRDGGMRCPHFCKQRTTIGSRCPEHAGLEQRYVLVVKEEDLEKDQNAANR